MEGITSHQIMILRRLREKLNGRDADLLEDVICGRLGVKDIQRVCEIINDEYLMKGIEENYSPNEYGRDLENLLNKVNAPRLS
jgi:hypothetical protein